MFEPEATQRDVISNIRKKSRDLRGQNYIERKSFALSSEVLMKNLTISIDDIKMEQENAKKLISPVEKKIDSFVSQF